MIDETILHDKIISAIGNSIPKNVKIIDYLMEALDLSRESVYRRIRKQIPFTIVELIKLSLNLGFSIDEIIELNKNTHFVFDLQSKAIKAPNTFISLFYEYDNCLNSLIHANKSEIFIALNEFPPLFTIFNENLFKFGYYRTIIECSKKSYTGTFSEMKMPRELQSLFEKLVENIRKIDNATVIFSSNIYQTIIERLQYFYHRKLLTTDELLLLKTELLNTINFTEIVAKYGYFDTDAKIDIYISSLHINSNTMFTQYDEMSETHFWIYPDHPLMIRNKEICNMQREWFKSMKKHSMLITQSNEIIQENFFNEQRKYVESSLAEVAVFP